MQWGQAIRKWYGRNVNGDRQLDISNDYVGYYTDNGKKTAKFNVFCYSAGLMSPLHLSMSSANLFLCAYAPTPISSFDC